MPSIGCPITFQSRPSVGWPTGTEIGEPGVDDVDAAREPVGRVHRDGAHPVVAEVLLYLRHERAGRQLDLERGQDLGQAVGEDGVEHDALDLDDLPDVPLLRHGSPGGVRVAGSGRREGAGRASASYPSPPALVRRPSAAPRALQGRRHTGGVVEASDVRGDEVRAGEIGLSPRASPAPGSRPSRSSSSRSQVFFAPVPDALRPMSNTCGLTVDAAPWAGRARGGRSPFGVISVDLEAAVLMSFEG